MFRKYALMLGMLMPFAAQAKDEGEIYYSYYLISCQSFLEHRDPATAGSYDSTADSFYVAGWLSAYNRLRPDAGIPDDTSLDDIMLWLENYCRKNPDSNLEAGLFAFGEEAKPRHQAAPMTPEKTRSAGQAADGHTQAALGQRAHAAALLNLVMP